MARLSATRTIRKRTLPCGKERIKMCSNVRDYRILDILLFIQVECNTHAGNVFCADSKPGRSQSYSMHTAAVSSANSAAQQPNAPVRFSFVLCRGGATSEDEERFPWRIAFNCGREMFVYHFKSVWAVSMSNMVMSSIRR